MLGPYTGFIAASYGVVILTIGILIAWIMLDGRAQAKALAELEARGITRRSARKQ
ncbi:MAG: heme exporter protein CcmD [Cohaesibacter sp.]|nr:heme exporter protein CcmD [Cohaesibacter sp.]MCV6601477.1 heme exporter protein CcmD [Cohaesibacter sp.]